MDNKVLAKRSEWLLGLLIFYIILSLASIGVLIWISILIGDFPQLVWTIYLMAVASAVSLAMTGWLLYGFIIISRDNLIELVDGQLVVRPKRNVTHTLALTDITVGAKNNPLGWIDPYGKVVITTADQTITIPFVSSHHEVAAQLNAIIANEELSDVPI